MKHAATRGEACHWILSRLTAPYESSSLATARNDDIRLLSAEMLSTGGEIGVTKKAMGVSLSRKSDGIPLSASQTSPFGEGRLSIGGFAAYANN